MNDPDRKERPVPVVHYLPPRADGRDPGSLPEFTRDPDAVTCPTCRARLTEEADHA